MEIKKHKPVTDITKLKIMVYGPPKIGKSSFAAANPKALILDSDNNGTQFLECFRLPCNEWAQFKKDLSEVVEDERFNTLVLDTVDMFWNMCRRFVCEGAGIKHESEDKGFGRIWDFVKTEFMRMVSYITSHNKGLWFISHAIEKEKKIDGVPRTVINPTLPPSASRMIMALCDEIIYLDNTEDNERKAFMVPQSGIECGGRLSALDKDLIFKTEKELFETITGILSAKNLKGGK